ncbi:hypothetical protein VNO80_07060 [Phaseolus coccineus]|uniref:Uncharacterized protein n=1 Tax=Phaseolus coccineus TaxID=3886 RepID=A0AAN9NJF1_PHACN
MCVFAWRSNWGCVEFLSLEFVERERSFWYWGLSLMMLRGERERGRERERERERDYATSGGVLWALGHEHDDLEKRGLERKWTFILGFLLCTLSFHQKFV